MSRLRSGPVWLAVAASLASCAAGRDSRGISAAQREELDLLLYRMERDSRLADVSRGASWTLCHCAGEQEMERWRPFFEQFEKAVKAREGGDYSGLASLGGARGIKDKFARMLSSRDGIVRGFGAVMLGVCGDAAYVPRVAKLLSEPARDEGGFDLGCAAMALGLLGAQRYKADLARLLDDPRPQVAGRAALGLGYMGARELSGQVARLLGKRFEHGEAQRAALAALAEMDARDQAEHIAAVLDRDNARDVDSPRIAAMVLAQLEARQYRDQIAALLRDSYHAGHAALALGLLGSAEHAPRIAALLKSPDCLVRRDAALALGLLGSHGYAREIAGLLSDAETVVRPYAAAALLLLDARQYRAEVTRLLQPSDLEPVFDWRPGPTEEAQRYLSVARRRLADWRRSLAPGG